MNALRSKLESAPVLTRVLPFAVFALLSFIQGSFDGEARYWIYVFKTISAVGILWVVWPFAREMRWKISWEAVVIGIVVFALWVGIDGLYPKLLKAQPWSPHEQFGEGASLAWFFIVARIFGSSLIVPPIEELFYRSFLYRYIGQQDFQAMPLNRFDWRAFLAVSVFFGLVHREWLAGILCGVAYQWLVLRKNRLGDAMTAHAITNLLLGLWVVWKNDWKFW